MKKALLYLLLTITLGTSCKKNKQPPAPLSQWTVDGITFKGYARTFLGGAFGASVNYGTMGLENGNNFVEIHFSLFYLPSKSGVFKVKKPIADTTQCSVTVGIIGNSLVEYSSDDSNSEVTITVSPSGKLTASFTNIVLKNYNGEIKTVSGTLIEQ